MTTSEHDFLYQPVMSIARTDVATLKEASTVEQALQEIRSYGLGERIVYFYVVDKQDRLTGVLPTRKLLTAPLDLRLSDVMIHRLVTIPKHATLFHVHEVLAHHKFLALPVVDEGQRIVGVVDVGMLTDEQFEIAERERMAELFETIGFRVSQVRDASPLRAFRFRFPWLVATIVSGLMCAVFASLFEVTLAQSIQLAFFLTLALGLGESVSIQSMSVTIQALRLMQPTLRWYGRSLRRDMATGLLLGLASGLVVGLAVWLWRGAALPAWSIGGSIVLIICSACFWGLSIPSLMHALRLDLRIASGPVTLAITDICTVLLYLGLASMLL